MTIYAYTSIATNYLPKARVLAHSVKQHNPDMRFALLVTDELPDDFSLESEPFDLLLTIDDLGIPDWKSWLFSHSIVEACTAVKPFALNRLLKEERADIVYYFDPDIAVFDALDGLHTSLQHNSVVLTPHIYVPEQTPEAIADNELSVLKHGLYNLGFVGVKNDETGRAFANWWQHRCYHYCFDAIADGMFTDQKWIDLVPLFFDHVGVLKEPHYNVCTWNYASRTIEGGPETGYTVNGVPLSFHHFSGYDSGAHAAMREKYGKSMPAALRLSEWYEDECQKQGQAEWEPIVWAYSAFDNGEPIRQTHRTLYRTRQDLRDAFPDPYSTNSVDNSFYHWLDAHDMLDASAPRDESQTTFGSFLQETEQRLSGFLQRTPRIAGWQKRSMRWVIHSLFGLVHRLYKLAGGTPMSHNT